MKKVLIATDKPFAKDAVEAIKAVAVKAGYEIALLEKYTAKQELIDACAKAEAVLIRSDIIDKEVIENSKNLKIVVRAGAGYDNVDLKSATEHGVVVMNTPGQNSNAVAELAFGMMLYMARGCFDGGTGTELRGKKLGIHAYGNVGKYVAEIAKGFKMDIYAFDPFIKDEDIAKDGVKPVHSVEELYKTCQYVSLHIPANDKTKKSIGHGVVSMMPKNGVLVNTARAEVIDEDGLIKIMEERPDIKYVSDIAPAAIATFQEKFAKRFFFTPKKMGAQTSEANNNAGIAAINQIVGFFEKGDKTFQVNK
ncbi:MAG TPA: NAD(P)-dependent oxidoreductase [Bacteroidales bacterium]|nr:NAD(P)-dependent oxidoreductase [Bacteroidales bacterium]